MTWLLRLHKAKIASMFGRSLGRQVVVRGMMMMTLLAGKLTTLNLAPITATIPWKSWRIGTLWGSKVQTRTILPSRRMVEFQGQLLSDLAPYKTDTPFLLPTLTTVWETRLYRQVLWWVCMQLLWFFFYKQVQPMCAHKCLLWGYLKCELYHSSVWWSQFFS